MITVNYTDDEVPMTKLKVITGGKGPPTTTGGVNWLNGLPRGTAFSCKKKGYPDFLEIYIVAFKYEKTIILVDGFKTDNRFAVDPEEFSKKYIYWETVGEETGTSEVNDDLRPLRSGILENDADAT